MEGKPTKKPYKPYITSPRCRGGSHTSHTLQAPGAEEEEVDLGPEEVTLAATEVKDGPDQRVDTEAEGEDSPAEEDSREGSLTKAPLQRDPVYPVRPKIKTKIDVIIAIRGDISQLIALREIRLSLKSSEGKKFEDYTYVYGGAEEPQLATATAMPQAYEDALSAMRQSLKSQDPLHGLNM